jgi:ABC-type transporter Mla subunit MlaD
LNLTNQLSAVLSNLTSVTKRADGLLADVRPVITNAAAITANLKDPNGSLGKWVLSTQMLANISVTLTNANELIVQAKGTVANTDSNLTRVATGLDQTVINLANITSNLNTQVQANTNLVTHVDNAIITADTFLQGLKHHWLLRSAFKEKKPKDAKESAPRRKTK